MHSRPLHHHIPPPHLLHLTAIQHTLDGPLQHDAVINALRPVHHASIPGSKIDISQNGAAAGHESELASLDFVFVGADVGIVVEVGGERGGEGHAHG